MTAAVPAELSTSHHCCFRCIVWTERKPGQREMRTVAVMSSLILSPFKFQQHSALSASLPWHIRESCNKRPESLKLNFTLAVSSSLTKQRAVKRNQSVMGVEAILFSIITADLLVLLASDLEVWIVLLTVLLRLFLWWIVLNKTFSYLRERYKCNHALKIMCNKREDSQKGTVQTVFHCWPVWFAEEEAAVKYEGNMLGSEVADKYLLHHKWVPINAAGKELHCERLKFVSLCILTLRDVICWANFTPSSHYLTALQLCFQ